MMKTISELRPGDRVRLPGGLIRTVREVKESEFLNRQNKLIVYVMYVEGQTKEWSEGNSGLWSSEWEVVE